MAYYHAQEPATICEVSREQAQDLESKGEFVATSYGQALFYLIG